MEQRFRTNYVLALPQFNADGSTSIGSLPSVIKTELTMRSAKAYLGDPVASPGTGTSAVVIPWPSEISWDFLMSSAVTMTAGGYVIERHPDGIRGRNLVISGDVLPICIPEEDFNRAMTASVRAALEVGAPLVNYSPSWQLLMQIKALLEEVQRSPRGILHLYAVDEAFYYEVEPRGFRLVRGGRNRTGARYELTLKALRAVDHPQYARALPRVSLTSKSNPFLDAVRAVKTARDKIRAASQAARKTVDTYVFGPIAGVQSMLNNAIGIADDAVSEFQEYSDRIATVTHAPANTALKFQHLVGHAMQANAELKRATVDYARNEAWGFRDQGAPSASMYLRPRPGIGRQASRARDAILAAYDADAAIERTALVAKAAIQADAATQEFWPIRQQDTIFSLAAAILGDAGRWQELVAMARLVPPYISAGGEPGTLKAGDRIAVPSSQAAADTMGTIRPFGSYTRYVPEDEVLYGRDLRLTAAGDLAEAPGSRDGAGLDVDTVAGLPNLEQNIRIRTTTKRGTNLLYPGVGLPVAIGMRGTDAVLAAFTVDALWQLRADDRVARVENFVISDGGNSLGFTATVVARNAKTFEV